MAEFTYHDYLLHKVVQPYSIRGQNSESANLKRNIPLYMTRQAGKVREQHQVESKNIVTKQAVQPPQVFLDSQFEKLQQQQEGLYHRKPGIDTNIGMNRTVKSIFQNDDFSDKNDPIFKNIRNRIQNEKYVDDFYVLTEGARPRNTQKEEKLSIEKEIKTVLQEKVNEDQLKKLYRKYVLETMKKNIALEKKMRMFEKEHEVKIGSLQLIDNRKSSLKNVPEDQQIIGKSASMAAINGTHSLVLQNSFEQNQKSRKLESFIDPSKVFGQETMSQLKDLEQDRPNQNKNKLQQSKQAINFKQRLSGLKLDFSNKPQMKETSKQTQEASSQISSFQTPIAANNFQSYIQKQDSFEHDEEETVEQYQMKQLQKLQEINKKQQQYKYNNKESEKAHIKNLCNYFDLSLQKLLNLEDKKQLKQNNVKKLAEITLESEGDSEQEEHFDDIEGLDDDSMIIDKNDNTQDLGGSQQNQQEKFKINKELIQCKQREEEVLFERIKYENEQNIINEQDEKLIKSIINLENKQAIFQKYVQKKKRQLQLQNLLNLKEQQMKKQFQNSVFTSSSPFKSKQTQNTKQSELKNQSIQSLSNMKIQNEISQPEDFVKTNVQLGRQTSYKMQNGKPVHEQSVISFLKSDLKILDSPKSKIYKPFNRTTKQQDLITQGSDTSSKKLNLVRLTQLSAPKYANQQFMDQVTRKDSFDLFSTQATSGRKPFYSTNYSTLKKNKDRNISKSQQIDFYTQKKINQAEIDQMKLNFLNFFDSCFDKKHQFEEEKQKLRLEISDWYCQNQQQLTKLSNYTGPKLSTLSQEFKQFIEQKNFKKKLFNYLINTMEQKDRQMAIYLYKQDRQLDDL
ncbi:thioredoxin and glutathione reductase family protein (macronuclear) [Tetrahymena thermophila SB210]|uniref:Thioredoxin and glutathione reductase family protein n=1 Tax=Tetrahymena thermophila (strain SB210) TaxID=312017 RepID=I7LT37_TETTS|nr:thioredoxin and glutathione reductase family protein [Tetrahymena thermophila SB210]EAR84178.2 thioredoxin and glutathione reductase family protein [Tetrahymena thermophila SB210]|eukprot:XP_001031841.2 thioredoxin and glutathione reductase family protein [Tetrahymena thermophila SB210]